MLDRPEMSKIEADSGLSLRELFNAEPRPAPDTWLTGAGWSVRKESATAASTRYGRDITALITQTPLIAAMASQIGSHVHFLTAHRAG